MKDFQIVRYVSNWKYLVALYTVTGGVTFYSYFSRQQVYTAYVVISYTNLNAKSGKTPSGADIDVGKIYSPNVVADAVGKLGSNVGMDFVRSRIEVEPIVSDEEQKRKEAILKEEKEYKEYPTSYHITFSVESDYSEDFAKNILNTVLSSYFDFYSEKYVARAVVPNSVVNIGNDNYDYIEITETMKQLIGEILEYLDSNQAGFRSSRTEYSFYNLIASYQLLGTASLDRLYISVLLGQKIKDRAVLVEKNNAKIESLQIRLERMKIQSTELFLTIAQYDPKILEAQEYSTDTKNVETTNSITLQDTYERKDREGNILYSESTYDTLTSRCVSYNREIFSLEQWIKEKQYALSCLQTEDDEATSESERMNEGIDDKELMEGANRLAERLSSLHEIVAQTDREYNGYSASKNIAMQNSVDAFSQLNLKVYMAMTFMLLFGVGCCGVIVIGRIGDVVEYTLYVDRKTKFPSHSSCDERIENIEKREALGTFICVVLSTDNLRGVNRAIGYATEDKTLEEVGDILKVLSKGYGFIDYNGANQFLCLLDNCTGEKTEFMLGLLSESIKQFSEGNPGVMMEMKARITDSKKTGIYQINKLISKAYETRREEIGQMMETGLISIIVTMHKREFSMLEEALDSVPAQTYARVEIIMVDNNGGRGERSLQTEERLKACPQVRYTKLSDNSGVQVARNTGIQAGSGELIVFLDDDDLWEPKELGMQISCFENPQVGLIFYQGYVLEGSDVEHKRLYHRGETFRETVDFDGMLESDTVGTTFQAAVRRSALGDYGMFDMALLARQDYEMWLRILKRHKGTGVDVPLFNMGVRKGEKITSHPMKGIRGYQKVYREYKKGFKKNEATRTNMLNETCWRLWKQAHRYPESMVYTVRLLFVNPGFVLKEGLMGKLRRIIEWLLAVLLSVLLLSAVWQKIQADQNTLELSFYHVKPEKVRERFHIVQLSDLHLGEFREEDQGLVERANTLSPDTTAVTGGMNMERNDDYHVVLDLCRQLVGIIDVYYAMENHELVDYAHRETDIENDIEKTGVHIFFSHAEMIQVNGNEIYIGGLINEPCNYMEYGRKKFMDEYVRSEDFRLLLVRYSEYPMEELKDVPVDLALCDHTHGRIVRPPYIGGVYVTERGSFPPFTGGQREVDGSVTVVNRGLGKGHKMPRINSKPKTVIMDVNWY